MECVRRASFAGVVAVAVLAAASCGGGGSTTAVPGSPTVVAPEPTPTPAGAGEDASANTCPIGKGVPDAECSSSSTRLLGAVEGAIDLLVRARPELFNMQEESVAGTGQYRVLDKEAYVDGVIANLRAAGLCAGRSIDPERVDVKSTNAFSEEFDIWTSRGFIRRGGAAYRRTCTPAAFPVEAADLVAYVRTAFFSFECNAGIVAPIPWEGKLRLGCDGFVTATPKRVNGTDVPPWVHGTEIQWELRDGQDVVRVEPDTRFSNPFNKILYTTGRVGGFVLCATVLGKQGCLNGRTIP
jgi:hypothetical protein